ncbi:hypothetical protein Scep_017687 [Stephania cephalantha]|uniref:Uncharacterized protein n=1 Tax=Stephania cephalantha TaxID=152367 RepID=A0AAP0IPW9_9MAGN
MDSVDFKFKWYEECCLVFENDRATSEEARTPDDMVAEVAEVVASGSDSSGMSDVPIQQSSGSKRSRSDVPEIMTDRLDKTEIGISKAILDLKETRKVVLAAMAEVPGLPVVDRAIYATEVMGAAKFMDGFLSLEPENHFTWLQRMFPEIM